MEFIYRKPKIILIAGKARSGKNTIANLLQELSLGENKKVVISPYTKYLKRYIEEIIDAEIKEDDKPREMLQNIGVELIKKKLGKDDMFIKRQIDDIDIYSYFFDLIIIPDVRFPEEIDIIREKYDDVVAIKVVSDIANNMTDDEKKHITETALDNYPDSNFDHIIVNNNIENLKEEVMRIYNDIK